ncbi:MAG: nitronate monooxygenase [Spirochaetia bacterium]|nr:nitronate monooxygenase [Spirochaetia bacterium]
MNSGIQTDITRLFDIQYPILGAPMFLVSNPALVAAVSNSGGMGNFAAMSYRTIGDLKAALHEVRALTVRPFGVNIVLHREHNPLVREQFELCLKEKISLIITSMGTPRTLIKEAHDHGIKVFCDVTNVKQASIVAKCGADAVIAVCQGAGGHAGSITPFALIPQIREAIDIPVIAAGAISRGRQMAAAFMLGASAVYIGTRFIATPEASATEEYKSALVDSNPEDIIYSDKISGISANWIRSSYDKWLKFSEIKNSEKPHEISLRRWIDVWSAGHGVAQIQEIEPVSKIMENIVSEYHRIKNGLP